MLTRETFRPHPEALEDRVTPVVTTVLRGGVLTIWGDQKDNTVLVQTHLLYPAVDRLSVKIAVGRGSRFRDPPRNFPASRVGLIKFFGKGGDDTLTISALSSPLHSVAVDADGGANNDWLFARGGSDTLRGGPGADILQGGEGNNQLEGGEGNDELVAGSGFDTLVGGTGHDFLLGGGGADVLYGGDGNDDLSGLMGDDTLFGEGGNDALWGGSGEDWLFGDSGMDWMQGGYDDDILIGDLDDPVVYGPGSTLPWVVEHDIYYGATERGSLYAIVPPRFSR